MKNKERRLVQTLTPIPCSIDPISRFFVFLFLLEIIQIPPLFGQWPPTSERVKLDSLSLCHGSLATSRDTIVIIVTCRVDSCGPQTGQLKPFRAETLSEREWKRKPLADIYYTRFVLALNIYRDRLEKSLQCRIGQVMKMGRHQLGWHSQKTPFLISDLNSIGLFVLHSTTIDSQYSVLLLESISRGKKMDKNIENLNRFVLCRSVFDWQLIDWCCLYFNRIDDSWNGWISENGILTGFEFYLRKSDHLTAAGVWQ